MNKHRILIFYIDSCLRVFDEGSPVEVRGEVDLANTDESWKLLERNINIDIEELSVKIIYDKYDSSLFKFCYEYFSKAAELKMEGVFDLAINLYYLKLNKTVDLGGFVFGIRDGSRVLLDNETADIEVSFDEMFSLQSFIQRVVTKESTLQSKSKELDIWRNRYKRLVKRIN